MRYILNSRSTLYLSIILRIIPQILCNIAALRKGRWERGKGGGYWKERRRMRENGGEGKVRGGIVLV